MSSIRRPRHWRFCGTCAETPLGAVFQRFCKLGIIWRVHRKGARVLDLNPSGTRVKRFPRGGQAQPRSRYTIQFDLKRIPFPSGAALSGAFVRPEESIRPPQTQATVSSHSFPVQTRGNAPLYFGGLEPSPLSFPLNIILPLGLVIRSPDTTTSMPLEYELIN